MTGDEKRADLPGSGHHGYRNVRTEARGLGDCIAELVAAQRDLGQAQVRKDDAIVAAADAGLSTREIGLALGCTHVAIVKRLNKLRRTA